MSDSLKDIRVIATPPPGSGGEGREGNQGAGSAMEQDVAQPAASGAQSPGPAGEGSLEERALAALKTIYDPEIPVNIHDLGLIYTLDVNEEEGVLGVEMTLTAPGCPVAQTFPGVVESRLREVDGVEEVTVKLVWDPPWTKDRMSEVARLQLGMY